MSNSGAGGGERTEKATPERLKKARQDGSIGKSQDLSGWVVVGAGAEGPAAYPMLTSAGSDPLIGWAALSGLAAERHLVDIVREQA